MTAPVLISPGVVFNHSIDILGCKESYNTTVNCFNDSNSVFPTAPYPMFRFANNTLFTY